MRNEYEIVIENPTAPSVLHEYGSVSIAFQVTSEFRIRMLDRGLGGVSMEEVAVAPYWVDYDAEKGKGPERWLNRWDLSNWALISAFHQEERVGGAVVAFDTPNVNMLDGRSDVTVLWDLRVRPDYRNSGVGTALFRECIRWAKARECPFFKIETQSYNVPACKFYAKQGAVLGNLHKLTYENPHHFRMIWWVDL